ncbi:hypothetical protein, partial [Flavobacterium psychrophilum]|uniref:hypothetical protein n=1 Tax=Flavobacterium psychrophilum TaxID=96345 RepID=UPI0039E7CC8A
SPRYAGDEKPSLLSHDVLPSPALLDFLREQALSKTPQSGGSLADSLKKILEKENYDKEITRRIIQKRKN